MYNGALTTFTNEEVLADILPSNWVRITPSKSVEPIQRECSWSRMHQGHARGLFLAAYGEEEPQPPPGGQVNKPLQPKR